MKKLVLFIILAFWLLAGKTSLAQTTVDRIPDQLDSLLIDNLADPKSAELSDIFYQSRHLLDRTKDHFFLNGNLQVLDQGKDLCLISNARENLQIFISNYLFQPKDFSIVMLIDQKKMLYSINKDGDGGYYKNSSNGYLVFNSLFVGSDYFEPMTPQEISYFNERVIKLLYLIKQATD